MTLKQDLSTAGRLFSLFRGYPWAIPVLVILGVLSSLAEGFGISLFIPFLEGLDQPALKSETASPMAEALGDLFSRFAPDRRLLVIAASIFLSILIKALLSFSATALFGRLNMRITHRLRAGLFEQTLKVEYAFIEQSPPGRLFNTLSTETWRTSDALSTLVNMVITLCVIIVYAALLFLISWKLTALVILFMVTISMVIRFLTRRMKGLSNDLTNTNALFSKRMVETIEGMKVVRAFGREIYELERFKSVSDRVSRLFMKLILAVAIVDPVYEILAGGLLLVVLYTSLQSTSGLTPLLVFIFVLYRLQPKTKELDEHRVKLGSLSASVREVISLLDQSSSFCRSSGNINIHHIEKGIRFDHVVFLYPAMERPSLNDVSLMIARGKTTALVGPSGGGKSTLIKLILRLYDPTQGRILVDSYPLTHLNLDTWRNRIALVSQDVYLFDATVRENIAYGRLDATEEEIRQAAKEADAHQFILDLPQGYDTLIGERGIRLSGGQQQRISLARAFLRNPEILILDEPTSVLDSISERLIQDALVKLRQDCTVLIIAHRLSTIKEADHIVVLDQGRVREQGDMQQLLALKGLFSNLYELQFFENQP